MCINLDLLAFQPHNIALLGYPKSFPIPSLNTLGPSFLTYAPDKQTDKQTAMNILLMVTDSVSVSNQYKYDCCLFAEMNKRCSKMQSFT